MSKEEIKEVKCPCGNKVNLEEPILFHTLDGNSYLTYSCRCGQDFYVPKPRPIILDDNILND
jgi:hypothetical protein